MSEARGAQEWAERVLITPTLEPDLDHASVGSASDVTKSPQSPLLGRRGFFVSYGYF